MPARIDRIIRPGDREGVIWQQQARAQARPSLEDQIRLARQEGNLVRVAQLQAAAEADVLLDGETGQPWVPERIPGRPPNADRPGIYLSRYARPDKTEPWSDPAVSQQKSSEPAPWAGHTDKDSDDDA